MEMQNRKSLFKLWGVSLCLGAGTAQAATFTVTRTDDAYDGICNTDCSLRDAITAVNATAGAHRIVLPANTYRLTRPAEDIGEGDTVDEDENLDGDLDVKGNLTIIGAGELQTVITSDGSKDRLFEVLAGGSLTLQSMRLTRGNTSYYGGAVENYGNLILRNVDASGNFASSAFRRGNGGAVANFGAAKILQSTVNGNYAGGGEASRGVGGAVYNAGQLSVRDSSFSDNTANDDNDNGAGGAIYNVGVIDIGRSTFIKNSATDGAALHNEGGGQMSVINSTLSDSGADADDSSVLRNLANLKLTNVTVAGNPSAIGLVNEGTVVIRNSIIAANNTAWGGVTDCLNYGNYMARGLLLSTTGSCTGDIYVEPSTVFTQVLYSLADNNGVTRSHALRRNSPALDAAIGSCPSTDQRGLKRPRDGNGDGLAACDLGSYERAYP